MNRFDPSTRSYLLTCIREMITAERWERFTHVVANRTRYLTVVLEDIFQPHNASAVLRTCELTGILDLYIIENQNSYEVNPDIVVGATKWINLYRYNHKTDNTLKCFNRLRKKGYRIIATSPHRNDCLLEELPLDQKIALVFGNEGSGLSNVAVENADGFVRIPSAGFTESYNISVAAAICTFNIANRLKEGNISWQLTRDEQDELLLDYTLKSIRNPAKVVKELLEKKGRLPA